MSNLCEKAVTKRFTDEVVWSNSDNNAFYESIKADGLKKLAEEGGLANGCDMRVLTPYWSNSQNILEVGAGYGRVIDYLTKHQFLGKITAIERCNILFESLKKKFNQDENLRLLHNDIRFLNNFNEKFDLILMLWSMFVEFSPKQQKMLLSKLISLLEENGKLIIDVMPPSIVPLRSKTCGQQSYSLEVNGSRIYGFFPSINEIKAYAKKAGFSNMQCIVYQTDAARERWLCIID